MTISAFANHSRLIGATAEFVGPLPAGVTSAGVAFAGAILSGCPIDFVRNDRGTLPGGSTFGTDSDTDGLGRQLETLLQSCDHPSVSAYCGALNNCGGGLTIPCVASLRDSDQDGFEDALEFYGYQNGIDDLTNIARFGAQPSRYDVFLEMDGADANDRQDPPGDCTRSDLNYVDWYEATQIAASYSATSATAGGFVNPDATRGISVHVDIPAPFVTAASGPLPTTDSPAYGNWGGASCVTTPTCTSDSNCTIDGVPGTCGPLAAGNTNRYCDTLNILGVYMQPHRRWLFRYGLTGGLGGGSTLGDNHFFGGGAAVAAHELGHLGGLEHGGPQQNMYSEERNFSPIHLSTMNYRYSYTGFWEVWEGRASPITPTPAERTQWAGWLDATAFTARTASLDPTAMVERCVPYFNTTERNALAAFDSYFSASTRVHYFNQVSAGCVDVDWDRDGEIALTGQTTTIHEAWRDRDNQSQRARRARGVEDLAAAVRYRRIDHPAEVVVTNATRRIIRNELFAGSDPAAPTSPTTSTIGRLTMTASNSFTCSMTPQTQPADRYPPCDFAVSTPTFLREGSTPVETRNFTACDIAQPNGLSGDTALVIWQVPGTTSLRWGRIASVLNDYFEDLGNVAGATPRITPDETSLLGLARTTTGAVLVYRNASGALVEQALTWSGPTAIWSAPATLSSTIWTGMSGSAALTHVYGSTDYTNGVYMAVQVGTTITFYRRTGAAAWTSVGTVAAPGALRGAPVFEFGNARPYRGVNRQRVNLFARFTGQARTQVRDSDVSAFTFGAGLSRMPSWDLFDRDDRVLSTPAIAVDGNSGGQGVRGVDYALVEDALVVNMTTPAAACPPGSSAVTVGARSICFAGSVPVRSDGSPGIIDCGASTGANSVPYATDGSCPSSFACTTAVNGRSYCTLNGFAPTLEQRAPYADGMIHMRLEQANEWPQMRSGFCTGIRGLRTSTTLTPTAYRYPNPGLPGVSATAVCTADPVY